jgi:hypothetical protein
MYRPGRDPIITDAHAKVYIHANLARVPAFRERALQYYQTLRDENFPLHLSVSMVFVRLIREGVKREEIETEERDSEQVLNSFEAFDALVQQYDYGINGGVYDHLLVKRPEGYLVIAHGQPLVSLPTIDQAVIALLHEVGTTEPFSTQLQYTTREDFDQLLNSYAYCLDVAQYQHRLIKQGGFYQVFERQGLAEAWQDQQLEPMILALLQNAGDRLLKEDATLRHS